MPNPAIHTHSVYGTGYSWHELYNEGILRFSSEMQSPDTLTRLGPNNNCLCKIQKIYLKKQYTC